jgi:hypothetical protein
MVCTIPHMLCVFLKLAYKMHAPFTPVGEPFSYPLFCFINNVFLGLRNAFSCETYKKLIIIS